MDNEIQYVIYVRKSTEPDDRQILSIPAQIDEAQQLQERKKLTVIETYSDSASAKIPNNRAQYAEMIRQIKKGKAAGIIVWKIDRLVRNHLEGGELLHLLQTGVIKSVITPHREYVSTDNALLFAIEASMAAQYSVDLGINVKRGLARKVAMGQPPGRTRLGYLNTKRVEHGSNEIIADPERWPLMRKAHDLMLTGLYTIPEITAILNNEFNFRTRTTRKQLGRPLHPSVLHRAFTDPYYTGYFYYLGILRRGSYTPMITVEEYDTIQRLLGRDVKPQQQKHEFPFTGLMKCGHCGCAITASKKLKRLKGSGEYKTYTFYHCTKRKGKVLCPDRFYTTEKEMEDMIVSELSKITLSPQWVEWCIKLIEDEFQAELSKQATLLETVKTNEMKIRNELETLLDLRISGTITDEQHGQKRAERQMKLIQLQEQRKRLEEKPDDWLNAVKQVLSYPIIALNTFKNGNAKAKKDVCNQLGWNWTLQGKKLSFTMEKWFSRAKDLHNCFNGEIDRLELKNYCNFKVSEYFEPIQLILRGLCTDYRTWNLKVPKKEL